MKCPHCLTAFFESWNAVTLGQERPRDGSTGSVWSSRSQICPECGQMIVLLLKDPPAHPYGHTELTVLAWPHGSTRPVPPEVDAEFAGDYTEAARIVGLSPKASAALSRRLLQHIIREKAGITKKNLYDEIEALLDSGALPSRIAENLDAVRQVGNIAAHTTKSENTGEIVEVEPVEAEFLLDVIEDLLDLYFVLPEHARKKREAITDKLEDAGKAPLDT